MGVLAVDEEEEEEEKEENLVLGRSLASVEVDDVVLTEAVSEEVVDFDVLA